MKKAKVVFHKCIQDSQDYGSDDEHMVSRVFFTLEIEGKRYENLHADIKQAVGSNFESDPIEICLPEGYKGPINYAVFRDAVERYYRNLVGSQGRMIHIVGSTNVRMRNNTFVQPAIVEFDVNESDISW